MLERRFLLDTAKIEAMSLPRGTVSRIAKVLNVNPGNVTRYFNGTLHVTESQLNKIAIETYRTRNNFLTEKDIADLAAMVAKNNTI